MVIIKYPKDYDCSNLQYACERLHKKNPEEQFIFIREDLEWIHLSLDELYKLRDEIDRAISDKEISTMYKYGRL
jgi:hypothetical protein